jgi:hypothetical protein
MYHWFMLLTYTLMKRFLVRLLFTLLVAFVSIPAFAQDPSFAVYIDNPGYVGTNQYEFDIMVKSMGSTSSFQLRTFQAGIYVDSVWVAGGALSVSNVAGGSQLSSPGYNGSFQWNATDRLINCAVNVGVRPSSASCVSSTIGTAPIKVARIRVANSVAFTCGPPNLKFNYVQNANPLRLRTSVSWRTSGCTTNYDMFYPNRPFTGQAYFNGELYSASDVDGRSPSSVIANSLPCTVPYNVTVFIEGYYLGAGEMQPVLMNQAVANATALQTDTITIELRNTVDPSLVVSSLTAVLSTTGLASCIFPSSTSGNSYWLVIKHRSSIETWSAAPVVIASNGTYNFTTAASQAYGDNLAQVGSGVYAMFSGDLNQDMFVDATDFPLFDIDNSDGVLFSYVVSDVNGDGFVDATDFPVFDFNNQLGVFALTP